MLPFFVLGVALLIGVLLAGRWFADADPRILAKVVKWVLLVLILGVIGLFALSGRLTWIFFALPALMAWFMRFRALARRAKNFARMTGMGAGAGSGQTTSGVETRFLRMSLDHVSGTIDGEVVEGAYAGRTLGTMSMDEVVDLLRACWVEDEQSARVLESYLDRAHEGWRQRASEGGEGTGAAGSGSQGGAQGGVMTREEALKVLGLEAGAGKKEIKDAHHRLMDGLHPDHGGSTYLAAKINQAREVLLGKG